MSVRPNDKNSGSSASGAYVYSESANFVVPNAPSVTFMDATSGNLTVELPDATTIPGKIVTVKKVDSSTNSVVISPSSGTIDGNVGSTLKYEDQSRQYQSDGINYHIVG